MKKLEFDINQLTYRFPYYNFNNFNNFNNFSKSCEILFNNDHEHHHKDNEYNNTNQLYILKSSGSKAYIWFTYYKNRLVCILSIINNKINSDTSRYYTFNIKFTNTLLFNNVLLYGYYFQKNGNNYFVLDNVINFNDYNHYINSNNYIHDYNIRLNLYKIIFSNITNSNLDYIVIPYISNSISDIYKYINLVDYNVYSLMIYKNNYYLGSYLFNNRENSKIIATFKITPCLEDDLYQLHVLDRGKIVVYDYAFIDSYKTSVFMNTLFRKIKENKNLDLLEESDSDSEFEDISPNKYVYLDKNYIIDCLYSTKFKKWIPKNISKNNIIDKNKLNLLITNKFTKK